MASREHTGVEGLKEVQSVSMEAWACAQWDAWMLKGPGSTLSERLCYPEAGDPCFLRFLPPVLNCSEGWR